MTFNGATPPEVTDTPAGDPSRVTDTSGYVEAQTADGVTLRGVRWAGSDDWVVLVHDFGRDLDVWRPLHGVLEAGGCSRIAFDLRGHGASNGEWSPVKAHLDIDAVLRVVEREDARRICIISAGRSGIVCLAARRPQALCSIALLSPGPVENLDLAELRAPGLKKLFIVGAEDDKLSEASASLSGVSIGWCYSANFPTDRQGCALLEGAFASHVLEHLEGFLRDFVTDPRSAHEDRSR